MLASIEILNAAEKENRLHYQRMHELDTKLDEIKNEIESEKKMYSIKMAKLLKDYDNAKANEQLEIYAAISAFEYSFKKTFLDYYGEQEIRETLGDYIFEFLVETKNLECCGRGTDGCLYFTPVWR